jgi:kynurenine formamidase
LDEIKKMKLIDLTHTLSHRMHVFPGEKEPSIIRDVLPDEVGYVTHRVESNMHTGTHMDAPFHVKSGSLTIDKFPVELFSGSAVIIDVQGLSKIEMQPGWELLFKHNKIVLFQTGWSKEWEKGNYYYDYPEFDIEIAELLVQCGVRIAGFDSPSPDKDPFAFHTVFLKVERFLVENLANLNKLSGKENIIFMAFPLKIQAEASLIRAVALIED